MPRHAQEVNWVPRQTHYDIRIQLQRQWKIRSLDRREIIFNFRKSPVEIGVNWKLQRHRNNLVINLEVMEILLSRSQTYRHEHLHKFRRILLHVPVQSNRDKCETIIVDGTPSLFAHLFYLVNFHFHGECSSDFKFTALSRGNDVAIFLES